VEEDPGLQQEDPTPQQEDDEGMNKLERDFYKSLRRRIRSYLEKKGPAFKYADILLLAPDLFHLLCRLAIDPRVPPLQKAKLAATIAYFISPIGLIPEAITGPIGYVDDIALAAWVLSSMLNSEQREVVEEHWAGQESILKVVQGVLEVAESAIGAGLWQRIRAAQIFHRKR
jgi:uncharacterized membrane protein YkvA (DUF1232 family)